MIKISVPVNNLIVPLFFTQFCHFVTGHILSINRNFRTSVGIFCKYMISSTNAAIALFVVHLCSLVTALFLTDVFLIMVQNGKQVSKILCTTDPVYSTDRIV